MVNRRKRKAIAQPEASTSQKQPRKRAAATGEIEDIEVVLPAIQLPAPLANDPYEGRQYRVLACGQNDTCQLGHELGRLTDDVSNKPRAVRLEEPLRVRQICAGAQHSVLLTYDGSIHTFGLNESRQLGYATTSEESHEVRKVDLPTGIRACAVVAGDCYTALLSTDGRVYACGAVRSSGEGAMTHFASDSQVGFVCVYDANLTTHAAGLAIQLSGGANHFGFVTTQQRVFTVGQNDVRQLGRGGRSGACSAIVPGLIDLPDRLCRTVWCFNDSTIVEDTQGNIHVVGLNAGGCLGVKHAGRTTVIQRWRLSDRLTKLRGIAELCGDFHVVLRTTDGRVFALGRGDDGRLGQREGHDDDSAEPLPVHLSEHQLCTHIGVGAGTSFAILQDGTLLAWGYNAQSRLGLGPDVEDTPVPSPQTVQSKHLDGFRVVQVAGGGTHTLLLAVEDA